MASTGRGTYTERAAEHPIVGLLAKMDLFFHQYVAPLPKQRWQRLTRLMWNLNQIFESGESAVLDSWNDAPLSARYPSTFFTVILPRFFSEFVLFVQEHGLVVNKYMGFSFGVINTFFAYADFFKKIEETEEIQLMRMKLEEQLVMIQRKRESFDTMNDDAKKAFQAEISVLIQSHQDLQFKIRLHRKKTYFIRTLIALVWSAVTTASSLLLMHFLDVFNLTSSVPTPLLLVTAALKTVISVLKWLHIRRLQKENHCARESVINQILQLQSSGFSEQGNSESSLLLIYAIAKDRATDLQKQAGIQKRQIVMGILLTLIGVIAIVGSSGIFLAVCFGIALLCVSYQFWQNRKNKKYIKPGYFTRKFLNEQTEQKQVFFSGYHQILAIQSLALDAERSHLKDSSAQSVNKGALAEAILKSSRDLLEEGRDLSDILDRSQDRLRTLLLNLKGSLDAQNYIESVSNLQNIGLLIEQCLSLKTVLEWKNQKKDFTQDLAPLFEHCYATKKNPQAENSAVDPSVKKMEDLIFKGFKRGTSGHVKAKDVLYYVVNYDSSFKVVGKDRYTLKFARAQKAYKRDNSTFYRGCARVAALFSKKAIQDVSPVAEVKLSPIPL